MIKIQTKKTSFLINDKKIYLNYPRKMSEKEVLIMKSFITSLGKKIVKTRKFKILKIIDSDNERQFNVSL